MLDRRDVLLQVLGSASVLALGEGRASASDTPTPKASNPLRVLILGGTGFMGPHYIRSAVERGHKVSVLVWTGSKQHAELPAGVERLPGDRNDDLESIKNRDWDAVLDLATYAPLWVRTLGQAIRERVRHYTFISTIVTYSDVLTLAEGAIDKTPSNNSQDTDENSKVKGAEGIAEPYAVHWTKNPGKHYGALKVLCEHEAEQHFPGKTLVLRPCVIVGPGDTTVASFTYWAARMQKGGEVLAAGNPAELVQWIDIRDLAEWNIRLVEKSATGIFNAVGPAKPMSWKTMLQSLPEKSSAPVQLTWVPVSWLVERKVSPWSSWLYWPMEVGLPGLMNMSTVKARANGLTLRSIPVTTRDTLAWYQSQPAELQKTLLMGERGRAALEDTMARERELLAAWHAEQV